MKNTQRCPLGRSMKSEFLLDIDAGYTRQSLTSNLMKGKKV